MTDRENRLRAARFEKPERIPVGFGINAACLTDYPLDELYELKGKHCVNRDIDRQNVTRFGTPKQIDDHIRHAVETIGSPEGGLMMIYGL